MLQTIRYRLTADGEVLTAKSPRRFTDEDSLTIECLRVSAGKLFMLAAQYDLLRQTKDNLSQRLRAFLRHLLMTPALCDLLATNCSRQFTDEELLMIIY